MITEPITISGRSLAPEAQARLPAKGGISDKVKEDENKTKGMDLSRFRVMVEDVQKNLNIIHDVDLQFIVHEASGRIMITVKDESTGEVIREIPPSEILDIEARLKAMIGLLFDKKG